MVASAKILHIDTIYEHWTVFSDATVELPNGAVESRVIEDHGDAAVVLLYDPDRSSALLIEQPRVPVLHSGFPAPLLEAVAGRLDGKTPEETARAEALEEAGVRLDAIEHVATLWSMPAVSTERLHLFLAIYSPATRVATGGGAAGENECIVVREFSLPTLWTMLQRGEVTDGKTFLLLQALYLRRPELFCR